MSRFIPVLRDFDYAAVHYLAMARGRHLIRIPQVLVGALHTRYRGTVGRLGTKRFWLFREANNSLWLIGDESPRIEITGEVTAQLEGEYLDLDHTAESDLPYDSRVTIGADGRGKLWLSRPGCEPIQITDKGREALKRKDRRRLIIRRADDVVLDETYYVDQDPVLDALDFSAASMDDESGDFGRMIYRVVMTCREWQEGSGYAW
jgi:hypothetical protein